MPQFGAKQYLAALNVVYRRWGGRRYRLQIVADSLGERELLKMQPLRNSMKNSSIRS